MFSLALLMAQAGAVDAATEAEADTVEVWADEAMADQPNDVDAAAQAAEDAANELIAELCNYDPTCIAAEKAANDTAPNVVEMEPAEVQGEDDFTFEKRKDLPHGWAIYEAENTCVAASPNFLMVELDHWEKNITFSFWETSIQSLKEGDRRQIRLVWGGNGVNDWQAERQAHFYTVTVELGESGVRMESSRDKKFLDKFASATGVGFMTTEGRIINAYNLAGSARAIAELRICAERVGMARPSDPFAN